MAPLRRTYGELAIKREEMEARCIRLFTDECGFAKEVAVLKVEQVRSMPQKNKRLNAIYSAHTERKSTEASIQELEIQLAAGRKGSKATVALQQLREEVHAHRY